MKDYKELLAKWEHILHRVENNNGTVHPIELGKRATNQEIKKKENEVGYDLPPSYKHVLQNVGKSLSFYYSFSEDTMIPSEFRDIFSGEINWNIDYLQGLDELADDLMDGDEDYGKTLRGKLEFAHSANGDIYAFDMLVDGQEKPVIYWDHEEDEVTYIADSFIDYLWRITELGCVGSEIWQLEYFLNDAGLETTSPAAHRWKSWFRSFTETTIDDVKHDKDLLISYVIYKKKLDDDATYLLQQIDKKELFDVLRQKLNKRKDYNDQKVICEIIGSVLGDYAKNWVESLWKEEQNIIDSSLRSYLTAMCMSEARGLSLVFNYLYDISNNQINGFEALNHLGSFHSRDVLSWMEIHVNFPVTESWDELFVRSEFTWSDIKKWSKLEEKHEVTLIHALEKYVYGKRFNHEPFHSIPDLPTQSEFIELLVELRDKQVLKKRISPLENVIQNIHVLY
ncbi:SMI1/KNR4 family protein [Pseudalkalibacillus sp. SCS-8]|uniref:SMI1/KNR4 family protein n=1 Tax=Pseudalkalibacillus nanhaiensis TaxID=3115291 RepID=UPI0032D9EF29